MLVAYLQVSIKPGQLVGVTRWQAFYQFLAMSQVRQPLYRGVVLARVVATQIMVHHGLHAHRVPSIAPRMEGTVAGVWRRKERVERQGKQSSC